MKIRKAFSTVPACVRQTDGHNDDSIYRANIASRLIRVVKISLEKVGKREL